MAKTASYPKFSPASTYKHPIMGKVEVYDFTKAKRGAPMSDGAGAQTDFFRNNAEIDNPKQFGIKLFSTSIEAFAAFQRQRMAAKARVAPPVGCMVQWKIGRWSRWGYKTCIADTSCPTAAVLLAVPEARERYNGWAKWADRTSYTVAENMEFFRKDTDWLLQYKRDANGKIVERDFQYVRRPLRDLLQDPRLEGFDHDDNGNPRDFRPRWSIDNYDAASRSSTLLKTLKGISLTGTQYDNLWEIHDDGTYSFQRDTRLELGSEWVRRDGARMGNDLHNGNIGVWRGRAVCIDFGFHCVLSKLNELDNDTMPVSNNGEDHFVFA